MLWGTVKFVCCLKLCDSGMDTDRDTMDNIAVVICLYSDLFVLSIIKLFAFLVFYEHLLF